MASFLREKLCSKELKVAQRRAEIATAILKKDKKTSELENDLQDSRKMMGDLRGLLPKAFNERDLMWEEVKQYSKNMLLNSEVSMLKKKISVLDKYILFKDGQKTILNDFLLE